MKFTLSWLKEYLDTAAPLDEITKTLTAIGLEVEDVQDPAATLKGFVVGHVVSAEKHPDADKLKCLIVDTGREQLKVVCGAPNARAGMKGVFAPAGSYIPGTGITLKKSMIRGQESNGMMCSERELCLSDEHNGIIDLAGDFQTGSAAADALGLNDPVIEINLTPNRGDCAGVYGIARDLAAAGLGTLKPPGAAAVKGSGASPVTVSIADTAACPLFIGRYIKGVKNGPSPAWLQQRLKAIGLRPISALVDITNYLCIGLNRPLHVFDADKLKGNITVRAAKQGETLEALNGNTYELKDGMIAVCDDSGVLGLGGVIGGVPSSVSDSTVNVFLEVALFNPSLTAMAGRALMIDSDARYRFDRGIDPAFATTGAEIATQMILDLCGGTASDVTVAGHAPETKRTVAYAPERLKTLGGIDLPAVTQKDILSRLGFAIEGSGDIWRVTAPSWRHDIDTGENTRGADIVEEILRIHGYDNIPAASVRLPAGEKRRPLNVLVKRGMAARRMLASRGLYETVTWSFTDENTAELFGINRTQNKAALTIQNPISADLTTMRPSVLGNLLAAAGRNADRGLPDAALFEIGNIYQSVEAKGQILTATGLRTGNARPRHWTEGSRTVDAYDAKADALAVLESCGFNTASLQLSTDVPEYYHPGRAGAFKLGNVTVALFGEIHPAVMQAMKRDETAVGFEVFLPNIPVPKKKTARRELLRPSPLQPLQRDFAFVFAIDVAADKIIRSIKAVDKALITHVEIFDIYTGKGVEPGQKSIALGVTLQPVEKTLTDAELQEISQKIINTVKADTGGILRG